MPHPPRKPDRRDPPVMAMQTLATSDLSKLAPDTVDGVNALGLRPRIDEALTATLGPEGPSLLAASSDKVTGTGVMEWQTSLPGTPVSRANLGSEAQFRLDGRLTQSATSIKAEAERLSLSLSDDDRTLGKVLSRIADSILNLVSGEESILSVFLVDDVPVVAGWGLIPFQAPAGRPEPAGGESPGHDYSAVATDAGLLPAAEAAASGGASWNILRTALTALGTFLVLSILLFLFFPGLRDYFSGGAILVFDPSEAKRLQAELYGLREDYFDDLSSCVTQEAELRLDPLPKAELDLPEPPEEEADQEFLSVKTPEPDPPPEPVVTEPKSGEGLVIPSDGDPNDLSFLEGCWENVTGLHNVRTGRPVTYVYCFNSTGKGTATIKEFNSAGKHTDTCRASVTAKRNGNKLSMRDTGPKCNKGAQYHVTTLNCSGGSGATACSGNSGTVRFNSKFKYLGRS
ncbi:MAG: hypothetical protein LBF40_10765 [Deltaproteobacteria bacterium]|nr:hypothetical protein [Deltaproteobacteria bacterium]